MYNSLPSKIGPSGTPQGEAYLRFNALSLVDPRTWFSELGDMATDYMLTSPKGVSKIKGLLSPKASGLSETEQLLKTGFKSRGLLNAPAQLMENE